MSGAAWISWRRSVHKGPPSYEARRIRAYIYPLSSRAVKGLYNPYLDRFMDSLEHEVVFVNRKSPSRTGILQAFGYLSRIDAIFLNWIENIPDRAGGPFQAVLFMGLLLAAWLKRVRIVWVLHNRSCHERGHAALKKAIYFFAALSSHIILTHSTEGLAFLRKDYSKALGKAHFIHHPVIKRECPTSDKKTYDILLWGTMHRYKGIYEFVRFCSQDSRAAPLRILVAGKFPESAYYDQVRACVPANITLCNSFIGDDQLAALMSISRYTLFPYSGQSVLSSGALMDAVGMSANIIGPSVGAFKDLARLGLIDTYDSFEDILRIVLGPDPSNKRAEKLKNFAEENSWDKFGPRLIKMLASLDRRET